MIERLTPPESDLERQFFDAQERERRWNKLESDIDTEIAFVDCFLNSVDRIFFAVILILVAAFFFNLGRFNGWF